MSSVPERSPTAGPPRPRQMLTFVLGKEAYGVDILRVQEIRGWSPVTRLPGTPGHVLGVLNLRGAIVPLIDLRRRFGLERADFTTLTVVIVLSVQTAAGRCECGMVVDGVADVVELQADSLQPVPGFSDSPASDFIEGLSTVEERMLILLNVDELVGRELLSALPANLPDAA